MATGTAVWINGRKELGFITPEDGGADVFVQHDAIQASGVKPLAEGQQVALIAEQRPKCPSTDHVVPQ